MLLARWFWLPYKPVMLLTTPRFPSISRLLVILGLAVLFLAGCATPQPSTTRNPGDYPSPEETNRFNRPYTRFKQEMALAFPPKPDLPPIYVLQFDESGRLMNRGVLHDLIEDVSGKRFKKLVVASLGWNHDHSSFEQVYSGMVQDYFRYLTNTLEQSELTKLNQKSTNEIAFVGISWRSSYTGFGETLKGLIPVDAAGNAISTIVDHAVFPLSVWSKSGLADRIAQRGLKYSLQYIYDELRDRGAEEPDLYLLGHSFGGRIMAGLLTPDYGSTAWNALDEARFNRVGTDSATALPAFLHEDVQIRGNPYFLTDKHDLLTNTFTFRTHLKGVLLVLPAITVASLPAPSQCPCPVIVLQSRHDHLNGFLYPIANLPYSTSEHSSREGVLEHTFHPDDGTYYTRGGTSRLSSRTDRVWRSAAGFFLEIRDVGLNAAFSTIALPSSYVVGQFSGIRYSTSLRDNWLCHTLAQIPLVEIPTEAWDKTGTVGRRKGLFDFGPLLESAGRSAYREVIDGSNINEIARQLARQSNATNAITNRVYFVDAHRILRRSLLPGSCDYECKALNYTLGWLDPIGAHADIDPRSQLPPLFDVLGRKQKLRKEYDDYHPASSLPQEQQLHDQNYIERRRNCRPPLYEDAGNNFYDLIHFLLNQDRNRLTNQAAP